MMKETAIPPGADKPSNDTKPLGDDEVVAICQAEIAGSLGFLDGKLAETRLKSLQYYNAEPYGNEIEGSSQIVTTEVRDTVESIMPSLMKIFLSGDKVAQFDPTGPEDEQVADQATDYANYSSRRVRSTTELRRLFRRRTICQAKQRTRALLGA